MNKELSKLFLVLAIVLILLIIGYFIMKRYITTGVKKLGEDDDIIIDYTNTEENFQIYEVPNEIENIQNNEVSKEDGNIQKYIDSNGNIAYIPKNFKVSDKQEEQTINKGLVVIRTRWK